MSQILQFQGRIAAAIAFKAKQMHIAWGTGDGTWTSAPTVNPMAAELVNEIGRRKITSVDYVIPDAEGDIYIPGAGYFSTTTTPTNRLYVLTRFDFSDASDQIIREIGLYVDTVTDSGLPLGQKYFTPDQVTDIGYVLQMHNLSGTDIIHRDPAVREKIELLVVF